MPHRPQESVWDYPRPPRVEATDKLVQVIFNGQAVAESQRTYRVLETSHPPVYYIPQADIRMDWLIPTRRATVCEYKGMASYWTINVAGKQAENAAWSYAAPNPGFAVIQDCLAFYASKVDACYVDSERVQPQAGDFYGGWITANISGPFKGGPGTTGW